MTDQLTTQEPAASGFFNDRVPVASVTYSGSLAPRDPILGVAQWLQSFAENLPAGTKNGEVVPTDLPREEIRRRILALEAAMFKGQADGTLATRDLETDLPLTHRFAPGAYAREIFVQKGDVVIGKIHRHAHLNFVLKGKAAVLTEEGPMVIEAPFTMVSSVGTKRLVVALEDLVWTTVHVTEETDLEKIEDHVIAKSYDEVHLLETASPMEVLT